MGLHSFTTVKKQCIPNGHKAVKPLYLLHPCGNVVTGSYNGYGRFSHIGDIFEYVALECFPELREQDDQLLREIGVTIFSESIQRDVADDDKAEIFRSDDGVCYVNGMKSRAESWLFNRQGVEFEHGSLIEVDARNWTDLTTNTDGKTFTLDATLWPFVPKFSQSIDDKYEDHTVALMCPFKGLSYPQEMEEGGTDSNGFSLLLS